MSRKVTAADTYLPELRANDGDRTSILARAATSTDVYTASSARHMQLAMLDNFGSALTILRASLSDWSSSCKSCPAGQHQTVFAKSARFRHLLPSSANRHPPSACRRASAAPPTCLWSVPFRACWLFLAAWRLASSWQHIRFMSGTKETRPHYGR